MDALAPYGACLASATAGWSAVREIQFRRPKLRLDGSLTLIVSTEAEARDLVKARKQGAWPSVTSWCAQSTVVNVGPGKVHLSEVFFRQAFDRGVRTWRVPQGKFPRSLASRESCRVFYSDNGDHELELGEALTAIAVTDVGHHFESEEFGTREHLLVSTARSAYEAVLGRSIDDAEDIFLYVVNTDDDGDSEHGPVSDV